MTLEEVHPVSDDVDALVINGMVTMYKGGDSIEVSSRSVDAMRREGWLSEDPTSLGATVSEITALAAAVADAFSRFISGLDAVKGFDHRDLAALQVAHTGLSTRLREVLTLVYAAYPTPQTGEALVALNPANGETQLIDPSQREEFEDKGFKVA